MSWHRKIILGVLTSLVVWGWSRAAESFGNLTMTEVTPRVMTPNGDLRNDVVWFKFDNNIAGIPISSAVYDITGSKVAGLTLDTNEEALTWDGRDSSGRQLPSGIYIYSISIGQNEATGTVVLAR